MQDLKAALEKALKGANIDKAVKQFSAIDIWPATVGKTIAKNTEATDMRHGVLIVKVSNSTWRQELLFKKEEILKKLNNTIGNNLIKDIRFI